MAQIFRPRANTIAKWLLPSILIVPLMILSTMIFLRTTDYVTGENRIAGQPVPFSHRHHSAEIGIDCRYCHSGVEISHSAGIPPTSTCMTCHSQLWSEEEMLAPVRVSFATGERLRWNAVHNLPDYVYFAHNVHVANGVACNECHGDVGEMRLIGQQAPLTMEWCLECHRNPGPHLSPPEEIYAPLEDRAEPSPDEIAAYIAHYDIAEEDSNLTNCSVCHR